MIGAFFVAGVLLLLVMAAVQAGVAPDTVWQLPLVSEVADPAVVDSVRGGRTPGEMPAGEPSLAGVAERPMTELTERLAGAGLDGGKP